MEVPTITRVTLRRVASGAYARIEHSSGVAEVQLSEGVGAVTSLERSAQELRDQAARLLRRAAIYELASMRI
jgi:hypothetical protein